MLVIPRSQEGSLGFDVLTGAIGSHISPVRESGLLWAGENWLHKFLRYAGYFLITGNPPLIQLELSSGLSKT